MIRLYTKNSTGVAPDGRWYAGDINALQDAVAAQNDLTQVVGVGTVQIGETGLTLFRYGAGEARLTGALRTDGILRGLGGELSGTFTTTARDAIALGSRPYGLKVLNTTTNRYEWNSGTDAAPTWRPLAADGSGFIDLGTAGQVRFSSDTNLYRDAAGALGTSVLNFKGLAAASSIIGVFATGDTAARLIIDNNGKHFWGPGGAAGTDVNLYRSGNQLLATDSRLVLNFAGVPLQIGSAAAFSGTATAGAGVLPATPEKFLIIFDNSGTTYKIPLYKN